jgi:hypothetical protein
MSLMINMLKHKLGAFGWHEAIRREPTTSRRPAEDPLAAGLDEYLARMGVRWVT